MLNTLVHKPLIHNASQWVIYNATLGKGSLDGLGAVAKDEDLRMQGVDRYRSSTWERVVVWPVVVGAHRDREP